MPETTINEILSTALQSIDSHPHISKVQADFKTIQGCIARIKVVEDRIIAEQKKAEADNALQQRNHNPSQE
ncbi:MAG: hypothetical protein AAF927_01700 [Bacteroidota bacterium]